MVTTVPTVVMELGKYDFLGLVLSVVVFCFYVVVVVVNGHVYLSIH